MKYPLLQAEQKYSSTHSLTLVLYGVGEKNTIPLPLYSWEKAAGTHSRMGGIQGLVRTGVVNPPHPTNVDQTLDCPTCSKFLYCVHYSGHNGDGVHKLFIDPENGGSMHQPNDGNDLPDDGAT